VYIKKAKPALNPMPYSLSFPTPQDLGVLYSKYGLYEETCASVGLMTTPEIGAWAFRLYDTNSRQYGWQLKAYATEDWPFHSKNINYQEVEIAEWKHGWVPYLGEQMYKNTVAVVEGPLDAYKFAQMGIDACAMLGVRWDDDSMGPLREMGKTNILWALDPDTWDTSYGGVPRSISLAKKMSPIYTHTQMKLRKDPKDMSGWDLRHLVSMALEE
jgi:hypothetical protein